MIIYVILKYFCFYILISCLANIIFRGIFIAFFIRKGHIRINLPKFKKFKGKISPIYKVFLSEYRLSNYYIKKYNLKYKEDDGFDILSFLLIPYPTSIYKFGYVEEDKTYILCKKEDIEMCKEDIGEVYESKHIEGLKIGEKDMLKWTSIQSKLNDLNKVYKDNIV